MLDDAGLSQAQSMLAKNKVMLYSVEMDNAFKAACIIVGSANMARHLGVTPQAVSAWKKGERPFPADRCPDVERVTQGQVRCEDLRPDVDWAVLRTAQTGPKFIRRTTDKAKS